jgi:hypothetical protein
MEDIVRIKFEKFYVQREGGFSLYPGSEHANLDGTGGVLELLNNVGALSRDRQELLWGSLDKNIVDLGVHKVQELKESDFSFIENFQDINSIRLYGYEPTQDNYDSYVVSIVYPKETPILDVLDLLPKVTHWINTTSQNMGNWVSKERIIQELKNVKTQSIPVSIGNIPLKQANEALQRNRELVVIGFDVFQVPKCKITFRVK